MQSWKSIHDWFANVFVDSLHHQRLSILWLRFFWLHVSLPSPSLLIILIISVQPVSGRRVPPSAPRVRREYPPPKAHHDNHEIINYVYEGEYIVYVDKFLFLLRFFNMTNISIFSLEPSSVCSQDRYLY